MYSLDYVHVLSQVVLNRFAREKEAGDAVWSCGANVTSRCALRGRMKKMKTDVRGCVMIFSTSNVRVHKSTFVVKEYTRPVKYAN